MLKLKMMAQGYGHAIAGIEFFGHVGRFDGQRARHHRRNLLFARGPGASDGLLDFSGGVFGNGNIPRQGRSECNPLGPAQFELRSDLRPGQ